MSYLYNLQVGGGAVEGGWVARIKEFFTEQTW